ncbi:uncharacterized protein PHALS_15042 [Plasmopara halstedii]|uniref:Uncharacterized protein n=1 Tax=Plasmopara halstedii TaxID=4781 RepID=A0A0N7L3Z6_PLAHL|nr:uncharacterized protein PHALS_15042 [Plasmopara halstedii]CEG37259.1 hypothetical protein PHALS_15042 [Plasmopara halstedii]|eukprot:XP_024573628.1 hypothetical protein PHALS_15042 [Plasmopara halstedii]
MCITAAALHNLARLQLDPSSELLVVAPRHTCFFHRSFKAAGLLLRSEALRSVYPSTKHAGKTLARSTVLKQYSLSDVWHPRGQYRHQFCHRTSHWGMVHYPSLCLTVFRSHVLDVAAAKSRFPDKDRLVPKPCFSI